MELPQPRPFRTEGKKQTHDFFSPYSKSALQHQDPKPTSGIYPETHDFLQPLERGGKNGANGENTVENNVKTSTIVEKLAPSTTATSVGHVLPGGIGTYSISHISNFTQRVPKPEAIVYSTERNGEVSKANSNCSSYSSGEAFTLWGESVVKENGAAIKDNVGERNATKEPAENLGPWSSERATQSPFIHRNSFSSQSSSKPVGQKNQSFMEMMKSASRGHHEEEEDDDEEFVVKNDGPPQKGDLTVKVDGKRTALNPVTPRSKHSATEQRRRSKINDRFQILRELIPHGDQKRDKASFLLEVIQYIQVLQDRVHKYEQVYPGWNPELTKLTPWRNSHGPGESMIDHSRAMENDPGPGFMFAGKFDENNVAMTPTMLPNAQNVVESDLSTGAYRPMDHHADLAVKSVPLSIPMQSNMFAPVGQSAVLAQPPLRAMSEVEDMSAQPQPQLWQSKPCTTTGDTPNEQEEDPTIEGGTISISSVYSQGLLDSLTQALQHSGVDLGQASISVQIDLGKRAINRLDVAGVKDHEHASGNRTMAHYRVSSSGEDSDQAQKRLKTERS